MRQIHLGHFVLSARAPIDLWLLADQPTRLIGALQCSVEPTDEAQIVVRTKK